jgi:hypothetical protein
MIFNLSKIRELMSAVDFYHALFVGNNVGRDTLSKQDKKLLKSRGVDVSKLPEQTVVDYAYQFGIISEALGDDRSKNMELKRFIGSNNYIPLTSSEKEALEYVKHQLYSDIKGLGNRVSKDFSQVAIEIDQKQRANYENIIKHETIKAIEQRKSIKELSSELGHKTGDWARDFDRIADYNMHSAYQHGIASQLLKQYGDDVKVYYGVYDQACNHCQKIYLTDGIESEPKIFKLTDVIKNGSNIGRKVKDWLPSINPIHPWCRCTLHNFPENGVWDKAKKQFIIGRNTYGVNRRSKIKTTITYN